MVMFILVSVIIICAIVVIIKGTAANISKDAPIHAKVAVIKRTGVFKRATFELDSGERLSFQVADAQASMWAEGDTGMLSYHKDFFKSFTRDGRG
ncbi:MAG: hypothetical protein PHI98_16855 [Eubacteriales bacterium]|nr:hypothetical protein [Eubacteriales bacterium]